MILTILKISVEFIHFSPRVISVAPDKGSEEFLEKNALLDHSKNKIQTYLFSRAYLKKKNAIHRKITSIDS